MNSIIRWQDEFKLTPKDWLGCDDKTLGGIIELGHMYDAIRNINEKDLTLYANAVSKVCEEIVKSPLLPTIKMIIEYHEAGEL